MFFQQSPKMLKIVSENFIHALLWFLSLFLKISRWVPLNTLLLFLYAVCFRTITVSGTQVSFAGDTFKTLSGVFRWCPSL